MAQQRPFINTISPTHVEVGEKVTISGSNLTNVNLVSFGGVSVSGGNINIISDNLIEAIVPAGATRGSIIVRNTSNLTSESSQQFFISFSGEANSSWKAEYLESISPKSNVYDICLCDLNNDGKNDVIMTHNLVSGTGVEATVFENQSTFATESFSDIGLGDNGDNSTGGFVSTTCADLDNDGDREVIFTTDNTTNIKQIYIYENNGGAAVSLSYLGSLSLSLPTIGGGDKRVPRRVKAADIDGDGKKDLVVGNENDNTIHIFPNNSTPGSFAFSSPVEISVGNAGTTGGLDIGDLDNDGKPDVVVIPAVQSNEQIYVLRNESIPGTFNLSLQAGITSTDQRRNVIIADFDNDGLNDIASTSDATLGSVSGNEAVTIYQNTSSGSNITFGLAEAVIIPSNLPWGLDAGDINGDGLVDFVVATLGTSTGAVFVVENNSTGGSISFETPVELTVTADARNICVGDINGDSKPDIVYSHDTRTASLGDLGVRINETCVDPVIEPETFSFCTGENFTLSSTNIVDGTYSWSITTGTGTVVSQSGNEATFNITSAADAVIDLQITAQAGCASPPTTQYTVNYEPGSVTTTPVISVNDANGGSLCFGDQVTLSTTTTFDEYLWRLPDGSTSTSATINISSASSINSGEYELRVRNAGGCSSVSVSQNLSVSEPPTLEIINQDLDNFCDGSTISLQVADYTSDFNYQWKRDGSVVSGATGTSLTVDQSGDYTVEITDQITSCTAETVAYTVSEIAEPSSIVNGPTETCINTETTFTAASTGASGFTLNYAWQVDGSPVTPSDPTQLLTTFSTTGNHTVTLTTAYDPTEVVSCSDVQVFNVTVSDPPTITFDQTDLTAKCQADVVTVALSNPAGSTVSAYSWTVRNASDNSFISNATGETLDVTTPVGVDTVWAVLDITTNIGCQVKDSIRIRNFQSDLDISSTDFTSIVSFDSALLEDATSINLTADNAASNISWEPAENFSDPSSSSTIFFPQNPTSVVTLTATDNDGCLVSTEVRIILDNIRPKRTFSPNGDGMNDCWEILNIGDLGNDNECKVFVFDSRGRNILVKENFENGINCVWDGNFNNSPVPEGVYYYVLKCNAAEFTKSGSILLAR
ncbi:FG-GAP-like repeat-containing protein [Ekhidna sp.]|uniref:FG-GAP-like repeat-containing protein n=1 Tax=Ekhidna sp. TaxID=2608089 RepID=UPI003BAD4F73